MYIYEAGKMDRRVMHIQAFTRTGQPQAAALCGIKLPFDRACNLPLGKPICKRCKRVAKDD